MLGHRGGGVEPWIGLRHAHLGRQRNHPRPDGQVVVGLVVDGRAAAHLRGGLVERECQDLRALELLLGRGPNLGPPARHQLLGEKLECTQPLRFGRDQPRLAEHDDRAVVDRVVEGRARQHEAVHQRGGHANRGALLEHPQHPARCGSVQVEPVVNTRVEGGDHVRLAVGDEADVAHEGGVEDGLDRVALVHPARGDAAHAGALGGSGGHGALKPRVDVVLSPEPI